MDPASFNVRATAPQDFVYSFGAAHRSVYGTSGDPFSPGYRQFLGRWLANQSTELLLGKEEVKRSGAEPQRYIPMPH